MNEALEKFKGEIVQKLVSAIEQGTAPWQRPWRGREAHQNAVTGRLYTGINQLALEMKSMDIDGGHDPRWLTFNQAKEKGWKIKKGSKGTHVTLWKPIVDEALPEGDNVIAVWEKVFTVFHASQIEGIGEYVIPEINEIEANDRAEQIISSSGARIEYGGGRAFYRPSEDFIRIPPKEDFITAEGYYSTLLHELIHWTGHSSRLNRDQSGWKHSSSYAFEELVAEIGSIFVACSARIPQSEEHFKNHASYVDGWLSIIKSDKNALFRAVAAANRAADYLIKKKL